MTKIAFASGSPLVNALGRNTAAGGLLDFAHTVQPAQAIDFESAGVSVKSDRIALAESAGFAAGAAASTAAAGNAAEAYSMLQTADGAMAAVGDRLELLAALAGQAADPALSAYDRAALDAGFRKIKDEIGDIVGDATFDGTPLLSGNGSGGPLTIAYSAGSVDSANDIVISVDAVSLAALSPDLPAANLRTPDAVTTAQAALADAQDRLVSDRAAVAAQEQMIAGAYSAASDSAVRSAGTASVLATPQIAIDVAQIASKNVAEEGGATLTEGADRQLRALLARLDPVHLPKPPHTAQRPSAAVGSGPQPLTPDPAASVPATRDRKTF